MRFSSLLKYRSHPRKPPLVDNLSEILDFLRQKAVIREAAESIFLTSGLPASWLIDTRVALLNPRIASLISKVMWDKVKGLVPFQLACMEITGIPLMVSLQHHAAALGHHINGVIIRREPKSSGRLRQIEGDLNHLPVVFVDDILNSGASLKTASEALASRDRLISSLAVLIDYQVSTTRQDLERDSIKVFSVFVLPQLGLHKQTVRATPIKETLRCIWNHKGLHSNSSFILPGSSPVIAEDRVYFCSSGGACESLRQEDGSVAWRFETRGLSPKGIRSVPLLTERHIVFGDYEGNLYSLDRESGKPVWVFEEADWIGSSPCFSTTSNSIIVGLEHSLKERPGSIVALDAVTGARSWEVDVPDYVHASPLFIRELDFLGIGCNDGVFRMLHASSGVVCWSFTTSGPIKAAATYDAARGQIIFGSFDKCVYAADALTGSINWMVQTAGVIYSTPLVTQDLVYVTSTDKSLYIIDAGSGAISRRVVNNAKLYGSPKLVKDRIYFCSTGGDICEYDPMLGEITGRTHLRERITTGVVFSERTQLFFVSSLDDRLMAFERIPDLPS